MRVDLGFSGDLGAEGGRGPSSSRDMREYQDIFIIVKRRIRGKVRVFAFPMHLDLGLFRLTGLIAIWVFKMFRAIVADDLSPIRIICTGRLETSTAHHCKDLTHFIPLTAR